MTAAAGFHYDLENSQDKFSNRVTTINCHGRLVSDTAGQLKDVVKQRIPEGSRIVIDSTCSSFVTPFSNARMR